MVAFDPSFALVIDVLKTGGAIVGALCGTVSLALSIRKRHVESVAVQSEQKAKDGSKLQDSYLNLVAQLRTDLDEVKQAATSNQRKAEDCERRALQCQRDHAELRRDYEALMERTNEQSEILLSMQRQQRRRAAEVSGE